MWSDLLLQESIASNSATATINYLLNNLLTSTTNPMTIILKTTTTLNPLLPSLMQVRLKLQHQQVMPFEEEVNFEQNTEDNSCFYRFTRDAE